ncbi:hypothetical protein [Gordonia malaquae]|nr:hypothetical protein [Gordonia malaquae]
MMTTPSRSAVFRSAAVVVAVTATVAVGGVAGQASADVKPGAYTSTTLSGGAVLLKRDGRVQGHDLVLIGRYRIHPMGRGSYYVDFFPGHRVIMNPDGRGGYRGPAYLGGAVIGSFLLTPKR